MGTSFLLLKRESLPLDIQNDKNEYPPRSISVLFVRPCYLGCTELPGLEHIVVDNLMISYSDFFQYKVALFKSMQCGSETLLTGVPFKLRQCWSLEYVTSK